MRILLIYPPISMMERYSSDIGNSGGRQVPLGVFYLASYVRKHGHDARIIDGECHGLTANEIAIEAQAYKPDVIGISSTTVAFHRALETAKSIKSYLPDIPIVLGGPHVTASVEDAMKFNAFDFGVLGEGELSFLALINTLQNQNPIESVKGIAFRKNGSLVLTPRQPYISDIDALPFPAYDLIPNFSLYNPPPCNYKKIPVANIITSRGCPSQCTFCDRSVFGQKLRQRSPKNIADEIELLYHRYGVREIAFVDDTFTFRPERFIELFKILDSKGIHFPWTCMSRVKTVDYDILKFMRDKGCWHISFGIESGNTKILEQIKKHISLDDARKVITYCRDLGIRSKGFFILGHPGETEESIEQTIQIALDMYLDDVVVTLNTPLPGSEQYHKADREGVLYKTDWAKYNLWNPVFVPKGLSPEYLVKKHKEFYRRFYIRPRIIAQYLLSFLSFAGIRRALALIKSLPFLLKQRQTKNYGN